MKKINYNFKNNLHLVNLCDGKANTIDYFFINEFENIINDIDHSVPLIITGNNKYFSTGLDLHQVNRMNKNELLEFIINFEKLLMSILKFKSPTISLINGHAIAGGFILICATDLRYIFKCDSLFGIGKNKIGFSLPPLAYAIMKLKLKSNYQNIMIGKKLYNMHNFKPINFFKKIHDLDNYQNIIKKLLDNNKTIINKKNETYLSINQFYRSNYKNLMNEFITSWFKPKTIENRLNLENKITKTSK
tara:strand:- start:3779 stop:4519 length:741 start_codon:yes stop_codon:yes gene_type:complete